MPQVAKVERDPSHAIERKNNQGCRARREHAEIRQPLASFLGSHLRVNVLHTAHVPGASKGHGRWYPRPRGTQSLNDAFGPHGGDHDGKETKQSFTQAGSRAENRRLEKRS